MEFLNYDFAAPFKLNHIRYVTVTQFIIAQKTYIFDYDKFESILLERNPQVNRAQELLIENVDEGVWAQERDGIVFAGLMAKFSQNEDLAGKLITADDFYLGTDLIKVKNQLRQNLEEFNKNLLTSP